MIAKAVDRVIDSSDPRGLTMDQMIISNEKCLIEMNTVSLNSVQLFELCSCHGVGLCR